VRVCTERIATDKKTRWTVVCPLITRRYIGRQYRGPATPLTAPSSTTSNDLISSSSSRHMAACRQRLQFLITATSQTLSRNTIPPRNTGLAGAVVVPVVSRRRCVQLVNVDYRSGQREILRVPATRGQLITTRSVYGDIVRCTTASYLQSIQVLLLIIQSRPT